MMYRLPLIVPMGKHCIGYASTTKYLHRMSDANKIEMVAPFLQSLGKIAQFYHIAIIVSLGAPKSKGGKEVYITKRDQLYGSVAWVVGCFEKSEWLGSPKLFLVAGPVSHQVVIWHLDHFIGWSNKLTT